MQKSGSILVETGTTNRTHLSDYVNAVSDATGIILKVHTSNFRTVGFTEEVESRTLVELGRQRGIPVMNDLGSGCFINLEQFGLEAHGGVGWRVTGSGGRGVLGKSES